VLGIRDSRVDACKRAYRGLGWDGIIILDKYICTMKKQANDRGKAVENGEVHGGPSFDGWLLVLL
jgi:hypothetical protein